MDYREDRLVEVNVVFLFQTENALKVEDADGTQLWIPKSAIKSDIDDLEGEHGDELTLTIGESLAREKGLI